MRGKVFPVRGCRHPGAHSPAPPGTWRPTVRWGCQGGGAGQRSWGQGQGHRFCSAAATVIVPGGIHQRHCRPEAGSHGPGPAPVGGVARQPPAPRGRDKGCHRRPTAAGPSSRSWPGGGILLGHGVAPGGAWCNNRLGGQLCITLRTRSRKFGNHLLQVKCLLFTHNNLKELSSLTTHTYSNQ
jgi:hypothetical protein